MGGVSIASGGKVLTVGGGGVVRASSSGGGSGSSKSVLTSSDFTYLGYYSIELGGDFCFGQGLTHRYVGGQLRFLASGYNSGATYRFPVKEFAAPGSFGSSVTTTTNEWAEPFSTKYGSGAGRYLGLWWNPDTSTLWSTSAVDYPDDTEAVNPYAMAVSTLADSGVVSAVSGRYGVASSISARRIFGGFVPVPSWFQSEYGTGAYAIGFGGYTSRMSVGPGSMGPSLYAITDPTLSLTDESAFGTGNYKTLANHSSGTTASTDWYAGSMTYDRGTRSIATDYTNYMNNGLDYQVLGRQPNAGVDPVGDWNAAPDTTGRWLWTDSAYQTGVWIDLATKHGYVIMPSLSTGRVWYQSSSIQMDSRTVEVQVFDPVHLGECSAGSRAEYNVKPTNTFRPDWSTIVPTGWANNQGGLFGPGYNGTLNACTFDSTTGRLYARWTFATGTWPWVADYILCWSVS